MLTAPNVTTLSGRQTQIKIVDVKYHVTDTITNADGSVQPLTDPCEVGSVVDVMPEVGEDGYEIKLELVGTVKEFVGYAIEPGTNVTNGLPVFRRRQTITSAKVWDGQTLVLSPGVVKVQEKFKDKVAVLGDLPLLGRLFRSEQTNFLYQRLFFFVTPTIIDPAGNRIHTTEEMPFATNSVPKQKLP